MIYYYTTGLLVTLTYLLIWFYSPLKTTIGQIFINKNISNNEDFETALLFKSPLLGKLLGCYICSSFWLSLVVGIIFWGLFDLPNYFPILTWFTYPCIAYLYKTIVDKNK